MIQDQVIKFSLHEQIKLKINSRDNIVQVKEQICSQTQNVHPHYYKIMKLKYNGNILDDNRYLLPYITDRNIPVDCQFDQSIDADRIVIINLEGNINIPKRLQIQKHDTIRDLRGIIFGLVDSSDYLIVKESKDKREDRKCEILKDESTICECQLTDGDCIKIVKKIDGKLTIKYIFEEETKLVVDYSNTNLVPSIKTGAAKKFSCDPINFCLFLKDECLKEDKYIFEYNIDENSPIKFYCLRILPKKLDNLELIDEGYFSALYKGKISESEKTSLILQYDFSKIQRKITELSPNGLIKYEVLKSDQRFVNLYGVYYHEDFLYVSMEYLGEKTFAKFLEDADITEDKIVRWSYQILEIIKSLHDNNIVYRYFKTFDFLIDKEEKENLKFFSFFLTEYLDKTEDLIIFLKKQSKIHLMYLSPEIRNNKPFDKPTDVWSFGVLLVDIINRKTQNGINLNDVDKIANDGKIKSWLPNWLSNEMKELIESCLRIDPNERRTVDQLLKHKLFKDKII